MSDGIIYTWDETHAGAKFSVRVQFPEGHDLHNGHSTAEFLNIVATAGSEFRKFVESETSIVNVVVWDVCGAISRMGTPESPPEYCEMDAPQGERCRLHGGDGPW